MTSVTDVLNVKKELKMKDKIKQIVKPENGIETAICNDAEFITGASYGKPRKGHPEGQVIYHIKEVLENIDKWYGDDEDREKLRYIALVHDTFKYKVDQTKPKVGNNHHGAMAMMFAMQYIKENDVLRVIAMHDEAYNAWSIGGRHDKWYDAERRANNLIRALLIQGDLDLYVKFYRCDNATGDKEQENYEWFKKLVEHD